MDTLLGAEGQDTTLAACFLRHSGEIERLEMNSTKSTQMAYNCHLATVTVAPTTSTWCSRSSFLGMKMMRYSISSRSALLVLEALPTGV